MPNIVVTSETVLFQIDSNVLCMIAVSSFIFFIDRANDGTTEWCRWLTESIAAGHCLRYESNNKQ